MMKFKNGFTLAEVFITLGVIGVVASLTMPNLIKSYKKHVTENRLKEAYSLISQSITMSEGMIENPNWVKDLGSTPNFSPSEKCEFIEKYVTGKLKKTKYHGSIVPPYKGFPYYKYQNGERSAPNTGTGSVFCPSELANGMILYTSLASTGDGMMYAPFIYIDINGKKGPNIYGKDLFWFTIDNKAKLYIVGVNNPREKILSQCNINLSSLWTIQCPALIQLDGWKISDDYKWF